jgi:S-adenosylmethionine synthetase
MLMRGKIRELEILLLSMASQRTILRTICQHHLEIAWSIANRVREVFLSGIIEGIGPDGKVQVIMEYDDLKATRIEAIIIAVHHLPDVDLEWLGWKLLKMLLVLFVVNILIMIQKFL